MLCMYHTTNFFADSTKSAIYNPNTFSPLINELKAPYQYLSSLTQRRIMKLCNIKSCEIENNLSTSPMKYNRDSFLQSGLNWQDYVAATKLNDIKEFDLNTFNKFEEYHHLSNLVTFQPLKAYIDTNPPKFLNDINSILEKEAAIYNHLCKMTINANTCFIMESRHMMQRTNIEPVSVQNEETEDIDGDDHDPDYNPNGWFTSSTKKYTLNHTYSRWVNQRIYKEDEIRLLFNRYLNGYEVPMDIINVLIMFTYGYCYTIDRLLRENIIKLDPEPYSFGHYNINWNGNECEFVQVHNSKVSNHVIEHQANEFPILNSIHSENNAENTMNWLYIKYEDRVDIYVYITDENGTSFGTRLTADNIASTLPSLFVRSQINVSLKGFESAVDPILNEYRVVLFKNDLDYIQSQPQSYLLNSFEQKIQDIINDCNAIKTEYDVLLELHDILSIFEYGNINEEYFKDRDNYQGFEILLKANDIKLDIINEFWYRLNGGIMTNNYIVKEEENEIDDIEIDLDELNEDIISNWHGEEQLLMELYHQQNNENMELVIMYEHGCDDSVDTNLSTSS